MKNTIIILILTFLVGGCSSEETFPVTYPDCFTNDYVSKEDCDAAKERYDKKNAKK